MTHATMACPDLGRWRTWLDGEAGEAEALAEHLAACPACQVVLQEVRRDASLAAGTLEALAPPGLPSPAEVGLARQRLHRRALAPTSARGGASTPLPGRLRRRALALGGLAAALALVVGVGFTPQGQAAAAQFLAQFRSQRFVVVAVPGDGSQLAALEQLESLGTVQTSPGAGPKSSETVSSVSEASSRVGFRVKQVDPAALPPGARPVPVVRVMSGGEVRFTFDRDKARAYYERVGRKDVRLPERFHGVTLVINLPSVALLDYSSGSQASGSGGKPSPSASASGQGLMLLVGQAGELTAGVQGNVALDELREFLLGLPGLPPDLVRQVRAIKDWRTTLPLPVPADVVQWRETTIAGGPALLMSESSGLGSVALWQRDGRIYGVAGTLPAAELKRVAESLN